MASLIEAEGEGEDCSVWIANLLSEDQNTWHFSLKQLRVVVIAGVGELLFH